MTHFKMATRAGRWGRSLGALLAVVISFGLASTASPAHADSAIAGVRFHTTVQCGGSFAVFTTNTAADSGSYAMVWAYDHSTGKWMTDNVWQEASAWSSFHSPDITFHPGYYSVYVTYAQSTTAGWQYDGEYITSYIQQTGWSSEESSSCYMNT